MATVAVLDERTKEHGRRLAAIDSELEHHDTRLGKLEINWARLIGIAAGAACGGGLAGGGLVAAITQAIGA